MKEEKEESAWKEICDMFDQLGKWAIGKEFIQFYTRYSWSVFKITGYDHSWYADGSGAYGQWDKRRFFVFKGEMFGMGVSDLRHRFSTGGDVDFNDIKGTSEVRVEGYKLGIPLGPKKQWSGAWNKFIELGEANFERVILSIGEEAYKNRDTEAAKKALSDFQVFLRLAPEGMFDELKENYIKRVKLGYELYQKYPEDRVIEFKNIDWHKVFK